MADDIIIPFISQQTVEISEQEITLPTAITTDKKLYPEPGDFVVKIGQVISVVWNNLDISMVNVIFYKGNQRLYITNKAVKDEKNNYSIFVDNSFFSADFLPCKIRIEMKESPSVYVDSNIFKVIRA